MTATAIDVAGAVIGRPHKPYATTVLGWVDGDTVDLLLDLGYDVLTRQRFRVLGVDTPERGRPNYREATSYAAELAPPGADVDLTTYKARNRDKYGRWLATITIPTTGVDVAIALIAVGLGVPYDGGAKP